MSPLQELQPPPGGVAVVVAAVVVEEAEVVVMGDLCRPLVSLFPGEVVLFVVIHHIFQMFAQIVGCEINIILL